MRVRRDRSRSGRDWVPGEGVEPSRAEAHGFLRPARLPVPPSRPGRSRVAGQRIRASQGIRASLVALLALSVPACAEGLPPRADLAGPTIAYLFDGSPPDAELVSASALAGLELAAHEAGVVQIEPVNLGLDRSEVMSTLGSLAQDRAVDRAAVRGHRPAGLAGPPGRLAVVGVGSPPRWRRGLDLAGGGPGAGGGAPAVDGRCGSGGRAPVPRRRRTSDQPRPPRDRR